MNPNQGTDGFAADLKSAFNEIREAKGPCPDVAILEGFASGKLDGKQRESVARHIRLCGVCEHLLASVRTFDSAADTRAAGHPYAGRRMFWFLTHPAFSYSLVAVLGVALIVGRMEPPARRQTPAPPAVQPAPATVETAENFELNTTRSGAITVRLPPEGKLFTLRFAVPSRPGFNYSARIAGPPGSPTLPTVNLDLDVLGNASVICRRGGFAPGEYSIEVSEYSAQGSATKRQILLSFLVRE